MKLKLFALFAIIHFAVASANLKIGFDYDDTLSFSTPAFAQGFSAKGVEPYSEGFWKIVNARYAQERIKWGVVMWAVLAKMLGFDVIVIAERNPIEAQEFVESWDWLLDGFYFTKEKASVLKRHRYIAYVGDSDSDIEEAESAGVWAIRARRSTESSNKENYSPGKYDEWVLPFSE